MGAVSALTEEAVAEQRAQAAHDRLMQYASTMCMDMCMYMCIDMRTDMCMDMCIDMSTSREMCMDVSRLRCTRYKKGTWGMNGSSRIDKRASILSSFLKLQQV